MGYIVLTATVIVNTGKAEPEGIRVAEHDEEYRAQCEQALRKTIGLEFDPNGDTEAVQIQSVVLGD